MNPIITADERRNAPRGVKILIAGPSGIGKTSLIKTIADPRSVLLLDSDCGDLAIQDVPIDVVSINDWQTARDIACRIVWTKSIIFTTKLLFRGALPETRRSAPGS